MMMNQSRRNAYAIIILVLTCCLVMVWVEGSLRPIYPVKSALKIAVFLGCTGLYALLTKDKGPFGAFRRSKAVKLAAPLALAVPVFLLGGYLLLSPWLDLSAIPANLAAKEGITAKTFPLAALYITFCNSLLEEFFFRGSPSLPCTAWGTQGWPTASPPWPSPCITCPLPVTGGRRD